MYPEPEVKNELEKWIRPELDRAKGEHNAFVAELDKADSYMDGEQTPAGYSEAHKEVLAEANSPANRAKRLSYVVVNQVWQTHEHILGQFIKAKQTVNIYPRGFKDAKKVIPLRKAMKYVEQRNQTYTKVAIPCIDNMLNKGLDWALIWYNPHEDRPNGKIEEQRISARDVFFNTDTYDYFYDDHRWRAHRIFKRLDDARDMFKHIEGFDSSTLKADQEYTDTHSNRSGGQDEEFCTIYVFQHWKEMWVYKVFQNGEFVPITEEQYKALPDNIRNSVNVDVSRDRVFFVTYYNIHAGAFFHKAVDWKNFKLLPCLNRRSERKTYPIGDFTYHVNLQDLSNVILTIILEDAKQERKFLIGVDPATYTTKANEIRKAIAEGDNVIPMQNNAQILKFPGVSEGVLTLFQLVQNAIDSIRSLPSVSKGELPAKQIAQGTVEALMSAALVSHGRKDIMISHFLTQLAKARYELIVNNWDQEDYVRVTDARPGDAEFVPINMRLNENQYLELLYKMSGMQMLPGQKLDPEETMAFLQFKQKFEQENDVQMKRVVKKQYDGQQFTPEEMAGHIQESGMTPDEFVQSKGVQTISENLYIVNELDKDVDVDIECIVDFEAERNKEQQKALTMNFGDRGWLHPVRVMTEMDVENPEGGYREAQEEQATIQIAERLKTDKNFQQAVALAEQIAQDPKMMKGVTALVQRQQEEDIKNLTEEKKDE